MATNPALQFQKFKTVDMLLPKRGPNTYCSGTRDNEKGFVRYALPSSTNPTLSIINYITDDDGNVIQPGYYELMLSQDRQMILLTQRQEIVATIPVFRLEENYTEAERAQPMDRKSQRKADKAKKKKEKELKKKYENRQIASPIPEVYTNASIQYDEEGDYYLIKYERDKIRAWGAIK